MKLTAAIVRESRHFPTKMQYYFLEKFCSCVCYLYISGSLEILDNFSVILRTEKYDTDISLSLL